VNANVLINSMNTGEVSGLVESRSDLAKFSSACRTLENAIPLVEGGAKKMPGTYFAGATANGGAMFTASIDGTTMTVTAVNYGVLQQGQEIVGVGVTSGTTIVSGSGAVGTYVITPSQTVASEIMQTVSNGKSRLVPFQFSTDQGAILEFSAGIVRIWEAAIEGSWSLGLVENIPTGASDYDPSVAYTAGNLILINPVIAFQKSTTGTIVNPNQSSGSVTATATYTNQSVDKTTTLLGFNSVATTSATLSVTVNSNLSVSDSGNVNLNYSVDNGATWVTASSWFNPTFPATVSIPITGITNLNTVRVQIEAYIEWGSRGTGNVTLNASISNWYASAGSINQGSLFISAPSGMNAGGTPITMTTNSTDVLAVTVTGSSPKQGINIALADATASKNAASVIQAAIRALGFLNNPSANYIDLSKWMVTPDTVYYASPWIVAATSSYAWNNGNYVGKCLANNQNDEFPLVFGGAWNTAYWQYESGSVGNFLELSVPYLESDLFNLDCSTQSADVLWIFHPNYPPGMIQRLSANSWQYSLTLPGQQPGEPAYRGTLDVVKTGYSALGQNITLISQANPCVVVLASSPSSQPFQNGSRIYINECSGLVSLNEGEFLISGMTYGSVTVSVTDSSGTTTSVTGIGWSFTPQDPTTGASIDSSSYQQYTGGGFAVQVVPMFAATGDYPACGALYQERLMVGGSNNNPTQLNGSVEDDYPDFICDPNADDYAVQYTLVSNQVNELLNMVGTPNALVIGTSGGVWIVAGSNNSSLSQTDVTASQQSSQGVSSLQPQVVNGSAIFVSRSSRIVTFLAYNFVTNAWDNTDLTRLNRNITIGTSATTSGIAQTAFQMEPYPIYWGVRNDGQLIGLVFNTQDQVYAWFRINMTMEAGAQIESVAVISGQNQEDQIVIVVNRTINGVTQRYVEYFMPQELFGQLSNAFFVHCGLQWQGVGPFVITEISNSYPAVVTAPGHSLVDGQTISISDVLGMTEANTNPLTAWTVAGVSGNTFHLANIDSTAWGVYTGGGTVEQVTNQVTGMSYLMGQNVVAVGDEQVIFTGIVTADTVVFGSYANLITIGLPYTSTIEPMNPVLGDLKQTSKSKRQKFTRVNLSIYESVGGMVGTDANHLYRIDYTQGTPNPLPPGSPATLFTGNVINDLDAEWTDEGTIHIVHSDPFHFTLRSVTPRLSVAEEG
jgi:hypothetical protein